jgi:monoamine oxidase
LNCSTCDKKSLWDIGGQWVGDSQQNITRLLKELNISTYKQFDTGKKRLEINGKLNSYNSSVLCTSWLSWLDMQFYHYRVDRYIKRINSLDPYSTNRSIARYLESLNFKSFLHSKAFTSTVRSVISANMRSIYAFELDQINTLFGLLFLKAAGGSLSKILYTVRGGAQERKVNGGTQQISEKFIAFVENNSAHVLLNTAMIHVGQTSEDLVEVTTENTENKSIKSLKAKKLISSIPINQYCNVKFTPELPYHKRNFFKFVQVGSYIKFIVTYKRHFWRNKGFSGEATSDGSVMWLTKQMFEAACTNEKKNTRRYIEMPTRGALCEVFDGSNEKDEPALVGFIAGDVAAEWSNVSDELRRTEVVEDLVRLFGVEARDYVDYVEKNWAFEPFNGSFFILI